MHPIVVAVHQDDHARITHSLHLPTYSLPDTGQPLNLFSGPNNKTDPLTFTTVSRASNYSPPPLDAPWTNSCWNLPSTVGPVSGTPNATGNTCVVCGTENASVRRERIWVTIFPTLPAIVTASISCRWRVCRKKRRNVPLCGR